MYMYAKDDQVGPIAGWPPHKNVEESLEIIRTVFAPDEVYAVALKEDDRAIGSIGLNLGAQANFPIGENDGEIGYWMGVPHWGKGYIPEAVRELMRHGFEDLKLDTIWCGYFGGNEKSKRVQEKCGFRHHHSVADMLYKMMNDVRTLHVTNITREQWERTL